MYPNNIDLNPTLKRELIKTPLNNNSCKCWMPHTNPHGAQISIKTLIITIISNSNFNKNDGQSPSRGGELMMNNGNLSMFHGFSVSH